MKLPAFEIHSQTSRPLSDTNQINPLERHSFLSLESSVVLHQQLVFSLATTIGHGRPTATSSFHCPVSLQICKDSSQLAQDRRSFVGILEMEAPAYNLRIIRPSSSIALGPDRHLIVASQPLSKRRKKKTRDPPTNDVTSRSTHSQLTTTPL